MRYCRYYYNQLSGLEKRIYDDLAAGIEKCETKIKTIAVKDPKEAIEHVYESIMADNPHFYYVDQTGMQYTYNAREIQITPTYVFPPAKVREYNRIIQERASQIIAEVIRRAGNNQLKREVALYKYFATHFTYDHAAIGTKDPVKRCLIHSMLGVFLNGKSVCEGFTEAFQYLLDGMGIESIRVIGKAGDKNESHAWNIVKLNRKYYHVDVTWAINRNDDGKTIWYDFLNITDKEISLDHNSFRGVPACVSDDLEFYKHVAPRFNNKTALKDFMKECLKKQKDETTFSLQKGWGIKAITNPDNGVELINEAVNQVHRELKAGRMSWNIKYTKKRNLFLVRFTYGS